MHLSAIFCGEQEIFAPNLVAELWVNSYYLRIFATKFDAKYPDGPDKRGHILPLLARQ
jgi:hypothetical protein